MNYRLFSFLLIICFIATSCLSDEEKREQANLKAQKELEYYDMSSIDSYPVFDNCDEMLTTPDCFYENLHSTVYNKLKEQKIPIRLAVKDSVYLSITVAKSGKIKYDSIFKCAKEIDKFKMDSLLQTRLNDLPVIESARKRSIPVSSSYRLPIVFIPVDSLEY